MAKSVHDSDPEDGRQTPPHRNDTVATMEFMEELLSRLKALEKDYSATKNKSQDFSAEVQKALAHIATTLEQHSTEIGEFRRATTQIARIAQVLEGAFGAQGLVGDVRTIQTDIRSVVDRMGRVESSLVDVNRRLDERDEYECVPHPSPSSFAPATSPDTATVKKMSKVIDVLIKVILALAGLLAAATVGWKFNGGGTTTSPVSDGKPAPVDKTGKQGPTTTP